MKPTNELKYIKRMQKKNFSGLDVSIGIEKVILQQKWEDENGNSEWRDIPLDEPEEMKKAA